MSHLFTYGTLMCEDIMEEVSGVRSEHVPGRLRGYRRLCVRGQDYPAIVPAKAGCVDGVVYLDLPAAAWARLDRFEGEMYARESVRVMREDGTALAAHTYVVRPAYRHHLSEVEWDFEAFLRTGKDRFRSGYRGYQDQG